MSYFLAFHWGWLLGAAVLGLAMGWIAVVQRGEGLSIRQLRWLAIVVAVLIVVAIARLLPGRFGYWLDLGLVMFAAYLLGCVIGSWLRERIVTRPNAAP